MYFYSLILNAYDFDDGVVDIFKTIQTDSNVDVPVLVLL